MWAHANVRGQTLMLVSIFHMLFVVCCCTCQASWPVGFWRFSYLHSDLAIGHWACRSTWLCLALFGFWDSNSSPQTCTISSTSPPCTKHHQQARNNYPSQILKLWALNRIYLILMRNFTNTNELIYVTSKGHWSISLFKAPDLFWETGDLKNSFFRITNAYGNT